MTIAGFCAWFLGSFFGWAVYPPSGAACARAAVVPERKARTLVASRIGGARRRLPLRHLLPPGDQRVRRARIRGRPHGTSGSSCATAGGPERRARLTALVGATAFGLVLVVGTATRLAGVDADQAVLLVYDLVICLVAVGLFADLLWGPLGASDGHRRGNRPGRTSEPSGTLRDRLARALGDPTLLVAYRVPEQDRYVDEAGAPHRAPRRRCRSCDDADSPRRSGSRRPDPRSSAAGRSRRSCRR